MNKQILLENNSKTAMIERVSEAEIDVSAERDTLRGQTFALNFVTLTQLINDIEVGEEQIKQNGVRAVFRYDDQHFLSQIDTLSVFPMLKGASSSTWASICSPTRSLSAVQLGASYVINRIKQFSKLRKGWDSYGKAKPIKWSTISRAIIFYTELLFSAKEEGTNNIPVPFVSPTSTGEIHFEWEMSFKKVLHSIPTNKKEAIRYTRIDKTSGKRVATSGIASESGTIEIMITEWLTTND